MAELTFKSPGVSTREIDLSGPTALGPQGTPAGIIGTALKGRAFVPITVATYQDFVAEFGATDGEKFGPLAMNEWMRNSRAGTYVRVLGVGDGRQRNSGTGKVTNAGFVAGAQLPLDSGLVGPNPFSYNHVAATAAFTQGEAGGTDNFTVSRKEAGHLGNHTGAAPKTLQITVAGPAANASNKTDITFTVTSGAIVAAIANDDVEANCTVANLVDAINGVATAHINVVGHDLVKDLITATKESTGVDELVAENATQFTGGLTSNPGQMTFLGCHMVDAAGSEFLEEAGLSSDPAVKASATLTLPATSAAADLDNTTLTLTDAEGTSQTFTFKNDNDNDPIVAGQIGIQGAANIDTLSDRVIATINDASTTVKITASDASGVANDTAAHAIKLEQDIAGAAGNASGGVLIVKSAPDTELTLTADFAGGTGGEAVGILRGAIITAEGVVLALASGFEADVTLAAAPPSDAGGKPALSAGAAHGTVDLRNGKQDFELFLDGHISTSLYPNKHKLSFDPASSKYFAKVLNTDPAKIREAGHYLYAHYDVYPAMAVPSSAGITDVLHPSGVGNEEAAVLLVGGGGRDTGDATKPNYDNFEERFRTAKSPFFISQDFGAGAKDLFRIHALDDGESANDLFKISIENIAASSNQNNKYGKFDLLVRGFYDTDSEPVVLEAYRGVNLDRSSENYIGRRIGDLHSFYDFDQRQGAQKLRIEGGFPNRSRYVRVEIHSDVSRGALPDEAIPVGYRGPFHLSLDGNAQLDVIDFGSASPNASIKAPAGSGITKAEIRKLKMLPVPMRINIAQGVGNKKRANSDLAWGVQFERVDSPAELNRNSVVNESLKGYSTYFPAHLLTGDSAWVGDNTGAAAIAGAVQDADVYNNNLFTLERLQVSTGSDDRPIANRWKSASYRRSGVLSGSLDVGDGTVIDGDCTRFLDPAKDFNHLPTRKFLKFTTVVQGGFDGSNIFDKEKSGLTDIAARREFVDVAKQGGVQGPTIAAYRKAIDVMEEKADVEIQLLAIPGLRHPSVTDYAIDSVENRFDAMFLMDIEEKDQNNEFVTGSVKQLTNVTYTVNNFESRNLDSSFAAAYFPDVVITDPTTRANVQCPPSVAVLGAYSLNDSVSHPWFAPAGFTRGALSSVLESQVKLKRANLDALYEADINPITSFPHTSGVVVFGQKTLQAAQSALDRVNVRRLLIDIRRRVKKIAQTLLFEPNRVDTLARFSNLVNPVLQQIQTQQGLDRYKVQIDTSTTTQADVENNTIRGKIFLQPTRSLEFISLDFVVTNQGAEI